MKKYFVIFTLTSLISFSFCERPSGHQLDGKTSIWGAFATNVDEVGETVNTNLGLDYSIAPNIEFSFDLTNTAGNKLKDANQQIKMTYWAGSFGFGIGTSPGNTDTSDFYTVRYIKDDKWISFKTMNDGDQDMWSIGQIWTTSKGCTMGMSYHFDPDDFDKGDIKFTWGTAL